MSNSDGRAERPLSGDGVAERSGSRAPGDLEFTRVLVESVNHHLRTPLSTVVGYAELLVEEGSQLPAELQQSLAALLRGARRLDDVIHGVCDLVAIACVDPETVDSVDLMDVVTEEVEACRHRAVQRGVRLLVSGDRASTCTTDAGRLRRALRELLDNAVTYAQDDSTVRVSSTCLPTGVRIEVSDDGDGIDPADLPRLTRPFERGTHPRQPATGRGMGLAVASGIAASLGGRLVLSEGPGPGFRARIELPVEITRRTTLEDELGEVEAWDARRGLSEAQAG